jgi:hypothetical protein
MGTTDGFRPGPRRQAPGVLGLALAGQAQRQVFAPYLWGVAAEREGTALERIPSASTLVRALTAARQLVESDVLHVPVTAEKSAALEALGRLAATSRDFELAAVIPGPIELGASRGLNDRDDRTDAFEDLARAVLESGCDVLMVREGQPDPETGSSFRAMAKLSSFFGSRTLVLGPPAAIFAVDAGFDGLDAGAHGPVARGVPVAAAAADTPPPATTIVTSSWLSPPRAADAEWLRRVARQIRTDGRK